MIVRWGMAALILAGALLAASPGHLQAQKTQRDRITREEIQASAQRALDAFQLIRGLRPHFLAAPRGVRTLGGSNGPASLAVYVNGKRDIGVAVLETLMARDIEEIRYLDPTKSTNEFGPSASGGAILVKLSAAPRRDTTP